MNRNLNVSKKTEEIYLNNDDSPYYLNDSWFINLTDTDISTVVTKTISLGKNFGIPFPSEKLPIKHLIADFESNIQKIKEEYSNEGRLKFVNCIKSFSKKNNDALFKNLINLWRKKGYTTDTVITSKILWSTKNSQTRPPPQTYCFFLW